MNCVEGGDDGLVGEWSLFISLLISSFHFCSVHEDGDEIGGLHADEDILNGWIRRDKGVDRRDCA